MISSSAEVVDPPEAAALAAAEAAALAVGADVSHEPLVLLLRPREPLFVCAFSQHSTAISPSIDSSLAGDRIRLCSALDRPRSGYKKAGGVRVGEEQIGGGRQDGRRRLREPPWSTSRLAAGRCHCRVTE